MRKRILCLLFCFLILFSSCNGKSDLGAYDVFLSFCKANTIPNCEIYSFCADSTHDMLLQKLYSPDSDQVPAAMELCDDYLICLFQGNEIWELHIFRTVSKYDNEKVMEMLVARRDLLQKSENATYYSEQSLNRVQEAKIIAEKNFVILAITDDNDDLIEMIQ